MAIEWNYLNPYMRPLSENLIRGVQQGLAQKRFQQGLQEEQRQFDAQKAHRDALLQRLQQQVQQQKDVRNYYNWAMGGGEGMAFQQPYTREKAAELYLNPFVRNYLGMGEPQKKEYLVNIPGQGQLPADVGYHYLEKKDKPEKPEWRLITTVRNGKPVQEWVKVGEGGPYPYYERPLAGGSGKIDKTMWDGMTMNERLTRNEIHYQNELDQRTKTMIDPVSMMPYREKRAEFESIQNEILQQREQDFYRIHQGQPPSWLTGADNPEQIQQRYNQLRNQGLTPNQIADQLRKEGIPIE